MPAIRAVLFDFFGTLTRAVQRGPHHLTIARALGCEPARLVHVLDQSFYPRSRGQYGSAEGTLRWVCDQLGIRPTRAQLQRVHEMRIAAVRADTTLRADALWVLRALRRQRVRTAIVSDCGYELPAFLPQLPIWPYLDATVYSVDVGETKPDPAMYLTACDRLAVRPEECLYIGDGGSQELSGARDLGMPAVRLAAPDLAGHLVFNADTDWLGPTAESLSEAVTLFDAVPA